MLWIVVVSAKVYIFFVIVICYRVVVFLFFLCVLYFICYSSYVHVYKANHSTFQ